ESICREYVARDSRVRYFRNERDLGPAGNHNRCFEESTGPYFRWHAHDDVLLPDYLEKCLEVLERDPTVANAHTLTQVIDEQGNFVRNYGFRVATDAPSAAQRFSSLIHVNHKHHMGYEIFGIWRREQLAGTPLEGAYAHGDRVLLVRMTLRGRYAEVPEHLFRARAHSNQSMQSRTHRGRLSRLLGAGPLPPAEWWDRTKAGKIVFPEWKLLHEYWASIGEVRLGLWQSLRCRSSVLWWMVRNGHKLVRDLLFAAERSVMPPAESDNQSAQVAARASH
ncbi:MAG: glycosyltransferase family 2 protein, partial [Tepidisphaeraceae bacterium]